MNMRISLSLLLSALLSSSTPGLAENWPAWRGAQHDGVSAEKGLPTEWDATKNVLWKAPLPGVGSATPCIWGERIFVTSEDGDQLVLLCFGTDGKQQWKAQVGKDANKGRRGEGNGATPSPSTDGTLVFAYVGTGDFAAFDFAGKEVWRFNAQERYGKFSYGFGMHTTPLLHEGRLYLQLIHAKAALVVALEASTGKEVWKVDRPSDGHSECLHSYASPALWKRGADALLITHGNDYAVAHRLNDGGEVWRVADLNPKTGYNPTLRFVASPVARPDLVVIPTAKNGAVVGIQPDAKGVISAGAPGEAWRVPRGTPDVPSPVIYEGHVYLCRENGVLTCLDAKTGAQLYSDRAYSQTYRSSPLAGDGKIYLTARDGTVTVVQAGRELKILAKNKLPDQITASPAVSNGRIYLRGFEALYAIGAK
jgi:outer membrane protein assembly factor BamB